MTRKFFFFSEMGYNAYPIEALEQYGYSALLFPNSIFDREKARDLWQMFLREHEYASEIGFDGSVCNEHHNNVLSMQESVNISAAVISQRITGTIALIGNPLPIHDNPVRVAEEIAMLDLISGGRIISGFVRGTGIEQLSTNANPAYNRERFEEAFALIKKTWTVPGPFRWEGKHYHLRVVNPWQLPLQKPHPPIWAAGILSPETIRWAARQRITYLVLGSALDATFSKGSGSHPHLRDGYGRRSLRDGPPPLRRRVRHRAQRRRRSLSADRGHRLGWRDGRWAASGVDGAARLHVETGEDRQHGPRAADVRRQLRSRYSGRLDRHRRPRHHNPKIQAHHRPYRLGYLTFWAREGKKPHEATMRGIELLGKEVIPALREHQSALITGKEVTPWPQ